MSRDPSRPAGAAPRAPCSAWHWWVAASVALSLAAGAAYWCWPGQQAPPELADDRDDADLTAPANPGYLGPQACAACHPGRVAEMRSSRHFLACCQPRPGIMPPAFAAGQGHHSTRDPNLFFEMTQSEDDYFQTTVHRTPTGQTSARSRLAFIYGSRGHSDELYFTWHDDGLYELPVVWLLPLNRWGHVTRNPYALEGDLARAASTRCLECHNTWFAHVPGTECQFDHEGYILGVTCERCHGPGRDHANFHRDHPDDKAPHAIVRPAELSRERQMEVCTQCHSNATRPRGPAFSYRPGQPLADSFRTVTSKHRELDHVANQVKYLRQSKCFQHSDALTCTTCHDPHRPNQAASAQRACLKCHEPAACKDAPRLPEAVRGHCTECHMPARTWINVHFQTEDDRYVPPIRRFDHLIAVHPEARQEVLLEWHRKQPGEASRHEAARLTRALVRHWLGEADKRQHDYRFLGAIAAVREALRLEDAPATRQRLDQLTSLQAKLDAEQARGRWLIDQRRYPEGIEALEGVLAVKPDLATVHGKLGTAYAAHGQFPLAVHHLEEAIKHDPDDPYGHNMLGWLDYLNSHPEAAIAHFRRADDLQPSSAQINYRWGLALIALRRNNDATTRLRKALSFDPRHAGAAQALSQVLSASGSPAEALRFARRAAQLSKYERPDIQVTLTEAYAAVGRYAEAAQAAEKGLERAAGVDPALASRLRGLAEEFRSRARRRR